MVDGDGLESVDLDEKKPEMRVEDTGIVPKLDACVRCWKASVGWLVGWISR